MTPISSRTSANLVSITLLFKCFRLFVDGIKALAMEDNRRKMEFGVKKANKIGSAKCKGMNSSLSNCIRI